MFATLILSLLTHPLTIIGSCLLGYAADEAFPDLAQRVYFSAWESIDAYIVGSGRSLQATDEAAQWTALIMSLVVVTIASVLVPIIISVIFAIMYKQSVTDKRQPFTLGGPAGLKDLEPGAICNCWSDIHLCLHSCFCYDVRAADTFQTAGLAGYWGVVIIFIFEWIVAQLAGIGIQILWYMMTPPEMHSSDVSNLGWFVSCFFVGIWLARKRGDYRQKFGGQPNMGMDFCCYWCCQPCSIAQDAKALDAAQGVHVECCCHVRVKGVAPTAPAMVVGQAVQPVYNTK